MFYRRRRAWPLVILLLLFGCKTCKREPMDDVKLAEYREKRRQFKTKLREAMDVWDEKDDQDPSTTP
jgi:hypothetical protein